MDCHSKYLREGEMRMSRVISRLHQRRRAIGFLGLLPSLSPSSLSVQFKVFVHTKSSLVSGPRCVVFVIQQKMST